MTAAFDSASFSISLDRLPRGAPATVRAFDPALIDEPAIRRLRDLGFDEGVAVMLLHQGPIGRDPIAVRVGRMTVAIRRRHAEAVQVVRSPLDA